MTDRVRDESQQQSDRSQQSSQNPQDPHSVGSTARNRSGDRDSADDRGVGRDRRSFNGDREHDELGSEIDDNLAVEDSEDMNMDDGLGRPDHRDQ